MHARFWSENLHVKDHPEDLGIDERVILERILEKESGEIMDWIHLVTDRDQWWAVVNTVMIIWVP